MKFNKLSQQRLFHKTNLCSHITPQHCEEMEFRLKPDFNSRFTFCVPLSPFVSLSCLCLSPSLSLCITPCPPSLSLYHTFAHRHRFPSFIPSSMLPYLRLSLSPSLSNVFLAARCKALSGQQNSPSALIQTPLCFIKMTGYVKSVSLKHFPIDCVSKLSITSAGRQQWTHYIYVPTVQLLHRGPGLHVYLLSS